MSGVQELFARPCWPSGWGVSLGQLPAVPGTGTVCVSVSVFQLLGGSGEEPEERERGGGPLSGDPD